MFFRCVASFLAACGLVLSLTATAAAHILVTPLRVVVTETGREAVVEIRNQSDRLLDISLSWIELSVSPAGAYSPATPDAIQTGSASPFLSVTPRRAVIAPDETIRAIIRLEAPEAPAGERRSHLLIETAAPETTVRNASIASVPLDMSLGVSIPVLLRGRGRAPSAVIETAFFKRRATGELVLAAAVARDGDYSAFGAFRALWRPTEASLTEGEAADGETAVLGEIENFAVYAETPLRRVELPLGRDELDGGVLELVYEGRGEYAGRVFARRLFTIEPEQARRQR